MHNDINFKFSAAAATTKRCLHCAAVTIWPQISICDSYSPYTTFRMRFARRRFYSHWEEGPLSFRPQYNCHDGMTLHQVMPLEIRIWSFAVLSPIGLQLLIELSIHVDINRFAFLG